jgi:hypothetical protein
MTEWRTLETALVEFFRSRGYSPYRPEGQTTRHVGEWLVKHGTNPINLSDLARELAGLR